MGQTYAEIPEYLTEWILKQHMFWVASAPLSTDGHINISPKGVANTFHVISPTKVWYEDLSGSGAETIAHIRENGRITVLFNAFEGPPRIARLYGRGSYHEFGTAEYNKLLPPGTRQPGSRAAIIVDVWKVSTTCGYSVPYYSFVGHRVRLLDWAAKREKLDHEKTTHSVVKEATAPNPLEPSEVRGASPLPPVPIEAHPNGMVSWWRNRNVYSLDGLPALSLAFRSTHGVGSHKPVPKGTSRSGQGHGSSSKANPGNTSRTTSDIGTSASHQTTLDNSGITWSLAAKKSRWDKNSTEEKERGPSGWNEGILGVNLSLLGHLFSFLLGAMLMAFFNYFSRVEFRALASE
ncbi:pyridoxamine phosphate oxidase [Coprinopsis cinerea okayama7|uniref:Pyridoxamine phosphate oxidase n=1 Tax=Coprinopsis cinerea (strain Okayama-7 / 130 / ATCC MYA-4618 / FGSC 9003) TaxID=240176 RepID=A8NML2_COPC7|nr:pyridoxamine phosphate oxidase [Coprinopsis cinerea okayama7\|eukprot:XP_001834941.2 pyridoxamine phosphate oxidase [Coprinopsis cinerea okayama7\